MNVRRTVHLRRGAVVAAAASAGAVLAGSAALAVPAPAAPTPAATPAPIPVPARYLAQTLAWQPCFDPANLPDVPGAQRLQCATYRTPRDWRAPQGPDLTIAVSRLTPLKGTPTRSILTNPGGPGAAGRTLPLYYVAANRTAITESREIVGIDPRGTGGSSNATCTDATNIGASLDPRNRSQANLNLIMDSASATARICQSVDALSRYITTEQTVRDMDLLRALLKRPTIDWIGYSGGTWMGAAYATYFPQRVGRFVLDGNTEFTTTWINSFGWQPLGFERRFRVDFLPWAATYDEQFHLGATPELVRKTYEDLRARLQSAPLDYQGVVRIDGVLLDNVIAQSLYSKSQFNDLAVGLGQIRALAAGNTTQAQASVRAPGLRAALQTAARGNLAMRLPTTRDKMSASFADITCNDTPDPRTRTDLVRVSTQQGRLYPLLGWSLLSDPCAFWNRTGIPALAPRTGQGVPPVLMLQNDRDPATPLEGAERAHHAFAGSKMITVRDEGNHTIYPGNPCVDVKVEAFLLGKAPAADATCLGLGLPQPDPAPGAAARRAPAVAGPAAQAPLQRIEELATLAQGHYVKR